MIALQDLQAAVQRHVLDGDGAIGAHLVAHVVAHPAAGPGITVARRLHIYHHAYRARLADALRDTFAHTAAYLGGDWFDRDAAAFIEATPSVHASLNGYGGSFAGWLAARHPADPDIGELALLDWTLRRAFDGADAPVLTLADLAALPADAWGAAGLVLHPTASVLTLRCNTLALWSALDAGLAPPPAQALAQPAELLVWRRGHAPHFRSLGALESTALAALRAGSGFAALCGLLAERFPQADTATEAGALLRRWADEALLSQISGLAG